MTALIVLLAAAGVAPGGVDGLEIVGAADCPSADAVRSRYAALAPADATAGRAGRIGQARVSLADGLLDVSLRSGAGTLVGQKAVVAPVRCDDRADVAAALLVAWSAERGPEVSVPYPEATRKVVVASSAAPISLAPQSPPRPSAGWRGSVALSFSVLAPLQSDPVVPALSLEGTIGRSGFWLEGLTSAGLSSERTVPLGTGTASWRTGRLRLGAAARLLGRDDGWQVKLAAGAGAAWVDAHGDLFATPQRAGRIAPEVWGGPRLGLPVWGPIRLIAAGQVALRLQRQDLATENPVSLHELPRTEVELTIGASVSFPTPRTEGL